MKTRPLVLTLACLASLCVCTAAQTIHQVPPPAQPKETPVPEKVRPEPFSYGHTGATNTAPIEFRTLDQMTQRDREVAANAESSIAEHTHYTGLEFNEGSWSYQQVICPVFPEHVFLRFMRNNGTGDVSFFTASIPRGNEGRVRIIPIQLRGYSLFSPAPINALTISAFNHIRAEENPDHTPVADWMGTALCYAALAGGHPQLPPLVDDVEHVKYLVPNKGSMEIPNAGGAILTFDDVSTVPRPMQWSMTFDGKGRLLKATHSSAELMAINAVKPSRVDGTGKVVPASPAPEKTEKPVPAPAPLTRNAVPPPQAMHGTAVPRAPVYPGDPAATPATAPQTN